MKYKIINWLMVGSALMLLNACDDYLSPNEYGVVSKDLLYETTEYVSKMSAGIYGCIPQQTGLGMSAATDEAELVDDSETMQDFNLGSWNQYSNPDDVWESCYKGIRIACDFLAETDTITYSYYKYYNPAKYTTLMRDLNTGRAEAHFIRAYLYLELMKRYGEVPLITDKVDMTGGNVDLSLYPRASLADIVAFISKECDIVCREGEYYLSEEEIAERTENGKKLLDVPYRDVLDMAYPSTGDLAQYLGRATRASAYALKAKALVYYASPLYNPEQDVERWKAAAVACKKVLDLPAEHYGLANDYAALFSSMNNWNKEFLFVRKVGADNAFERANYPVSIEGGNTGICPSQNLVDAYEVITGNVAVPFDWNNKAHKENPYSGRDPRLEATIYKHGDLYDEKVNPIKLNVKLNGNSGAPLYHATKTGYYLKKYVNPSLNLKNDQKGYKTWVLMRMADFYLYYAEAMNEAYGPDAKADDLKLTARAALNKVRLRAKMPEYTGGKGDKDVFREKVYEERRVELAFENARWWDVRRWKRGQELNKDIRGVSVSWRGYEPVVVEQRQFDESKMYFYPIPQEEVDKSGGVLTQNPGW